MNIVINELQERFETKIYPVGPINVGEIKDLIRSVERVNTGKKGVYFIDYFS